VEAMEWIEENDGDYIFGLPGNSTLDALVAKVADNLRFHHAKSRQPKVRTYTSFTYQAGSWTRPRKVVARLECSLQPDAGEPTCDSSFLLCKLSETPAVPARICDFKWML